MRKNTDRRGFELARDVLGFQLKLLLDTARDLITSPIALVASLLDLLLLRQQEPRFFRAVLRLGKRSEEWIDLWASAYEERAQPETVDSLINSVEAVLRDPRSGARRAKVLRRWAERELARRKRSPATETVSAPAPTKDDSNT